MSALGYLMRTAIAASIIAVLAFFGSIEDLGGYLTQADGVVVFTGEPQRILTGVKVLSAGHARRMLITGTELSAGTDTAEVMAEVRREYSYWASCCIDLDPEAQNTFENARDAKRWARSHEFSSLILVTTDYHMPRALLELRSALPDVRIRSPFTSDRRLALGKPGAGSALDRRICKVRGRFDDCASPTPSCK